MKNLLTNLFLFVLFCIAFSSFSACRTSGTSNGSAVDSASNASNTAKTSNSMIGEAKNSNFPPVPTDLYQAEIKDLEGSSYNLESKKGKVVLVSLWATWCGPCIAEMPHLKELQEKYQAQGFEVIGLNTGDNETGEPESVGKIKAFVAQKQLNYPIGYADENFFSQMVKITRLNAIPQSILINREGKMTGIFKGGGSQVVNEIKKTVEKTVSE